MPVLSHFSQLKVAIFLKEFKQLIQNKEFIFVHRDENQNSLLELSLTKETCKDELLSLTIEDYCSGPEPNHSMPGEIWVFGKVIKCQEVYIKLKIEDFASRKIGKCLSFHTAKFSLCYPYKPSK